MEVLGPDHPGVAPYLEKSWWDALRQLGRREEARELHAKARVLSQRARRVGRVCWM